ncbi:hypothetical protein LTR85_011656 [Meristemomyces frigidus]|nr:hypothetical protein LTR85_011656 [Meristemomyces frigidus]
MATNPTPIFSELKKSLLDLPPELRNQVYEAVTILEYAAEKVKINRRGQIITPKNNLSAVCRQTEKESTLIFLDYAKHHVTSFVAEVEDFRLMPLDSRLKKLFSHAPTDTLNGKRKLVLYLTFEDACSEPSIEGLLQWLDPCVNSESLATFERKYYVEFDWSCFEPDDADWLQGTVQKQVQAHHGKEGLRADHACYG